jgi:hypothetical protein
MIAEICFTADWLENKRRELRGVNPSLLERALHAFALLGHLAESDLKFVFKGGTGGQYKGRVSKNQKLRIPGTSILNS